jgi:predicted aminopeptidase
VTLAGCSTLEGLGYYRQSIGGHLSLLWTARPVAEVIADPATPPATAERLQLSQRMRAFAVDELALPDNATYRRFADLKRPSVVWNVVAAPELSLKLKTWCFPVVGCVGYRGYYSEADARAFAEPLKAEGYELSVYGVPAYSTLGQLPDWAITSDPLLNTFIHWPEGELARLIFHELAHQVAYARDDTEFNESYATAVERLGAARWLARHGTPESRAANDQLDGRRNEFRALTMATRERLLAVYASNASDDEKRRQKAELMARLRADHEMLKRERWGGFAGYDGWFARANNATLGVQAAYNALVPAFEAVFARIEGEQAASTSSRLLFKRFHAEVQSLAALPNREARRAALEAAAAAPVGTRQAATGPG